MRPKWMRFSFMDVAIAVLVLGTAAAISLSRATKASFTVSASEITSRLQGIRSQIDRFKADHNKTPPQPAGMANWGNMRARSDATETNVSRPKGTHFGPYMHVVPVNPLNQKTATSPLDRDASTGWYYSATATAYTILPRDANGDKITSYQN